MSNTENMSVGDMDRAIVEILVDNGMDENAAVQTVLSMSTLDMERYLEDAASEG